jgi:exonuclease SbcD
MSKDHPAGPTDGPIRLLHFADAHFGVETYGRYDPESGLSTRLLDFRAALNAGIDIALTDDIEIALFCGDAYKSRDPSQTHQREFAACLKRLTDAHVPVVLLTGNHDIPNTKGKANAIEIYRALGSNLVTVLDRRDVVAIPTRAGRLLQIAAVPYLTKSLLLARDDSAQMGVQETMDAVADRYRDAIDQLAEQCALRPDLPTVLMGHFTVATAQVAFTQAAYFVNEPQVPKECLRRPEFDYVALGHIHKFQDLNPGHQPPIVYCGSIERIDFGERAEPKGMVLASVARGNADYRHVELPARPFLDILIDVSRRLEGAPPTDPTDKILAELARHQIESAVLKLTYRVAPEESALVRERDIRQALGRAFLVVAQTREVAGETFAAQVRSKLLKESLEPLDALSTYLDSKEHLAKRKEGLMGKARELWGEMEGESIERDMPS